MAKDSWKTKLSQLFMGYLGIFAGEDRFIHQHRGKSSMLKEQNRYGHPDQHPKN